MLPGAGGKGGMAAGSSSKQGDNGENEKSHGCCPQCFLQGDLPLHSMIRCETYGGNLASGELTPNRNKFALYNPYRLPYASKYHAKIGQQLGAGSRAASAFR